MPKKSDSGGKRMKCHWCKQFLSPQTGMATIREPEIYYCHRCYSKGLEEEKIAMGVYDER
jgi:hypothetical protein